MKTNVFILLAFLLGINNSLTAQNDAECAAKTSIFHEAVKSGNIEAAYEPWMYVRTNCPSYHKAIISDGEKILEYKLEKSTGADKVTFIKDMLKLQDEASTNFSSDYPKGETELEKAEIQYNYREELGLTTEELYNIFETVYKNYKADFKKPKPLYAYFSLMVDLYDAGKKQPQELFDKYDDVIDKINEEIDANSEKLNKYVQKEEGGTALTSKEEKYKKYYGQMIETYDKVTKSIDSKLGERANCETLIPLYKKDFESHKEDAIWLKRAVNRMYNKECTDDALYIELVKAYDQTAPSADTKVFVAGLLLKDGKTNEALNYFKEAINLETDAYKQGKLAKKIGRVLKQKGRYSEARTYFKKSLSLNPSDGMPHLYIAEMYAASANNCGTTSFEKRAVYWLAATEAEKAGRVDPTLKSHAAQVAAVYKAKAPSKSDIFGSNKQGATITFNCWIGGSVTVPNL